MTSTVGWNVAVPPNGFINRPRQTAASNDNPDGLATPDLYAGVETTPEHRNLAAGDPTCVGWERRRDDPGVKALRETLRVNNGIPDLETCTPDQVERAVELFHRDGFVVVTIALDARRLANLKRATERVVDEILVADPDASAGGGAGGLPHRYSFGSSSASRHRLHEPEWVDVIDLLTTTPILTAIFGSADYVVGGGGGDLALPGAIEYQGLHSDNIWVEPHDPVGNLSIRQMPVPVVTINFPMIDLTWQNGPIRQIPGTQRSLDPIPTLADEPNWMKWSTLCPTPAGSAVIRDNRCWHSGTPNLSDDVRSMPNVEYFAPWFRSEGVNRCLPYDLWTTLSEHGKRVTRYVAGHDGETIIGAGYTSPRAKDRDAFIDAQCAELGSAVAAEWWARR